MAVDTIKVIGYFGRRYDIQKWELMASDRMYIDGIWYKRYVIRDGK